MCPVFLQLGVGGSSLHKKDAMAKGRRFGQERQANLFPSTRDLSDGYSNIPELTQLTTGTSFKKSEGRAFMCCARIRLPSCVAASARLASDGSASAASRKATSPAMPSRCSFWLARQQPLVQVQGF